jgi:DNA polymerase I
MARLFLIDTFGYLFRAFHARARTGAPPMRTSKGEPTEVPFLFNNMLRKLISMHKPDYIAAVWESATPTLREQEFTAYKANREPTPPEFTQQLPAVRKLLEAMRIPALEFDGYEADDVIGTLARREAAAGHHVIIVSSDKDLLQLVDDGSGAGHILMLNPAKDDTIYDAAKVEEYMGVPPGQVADLLALKGDAVDNIPGAPGIGDKGARDLLKQFPNVEAALDGAAQVQRKMYRESLQNNREQIELSKRLAVVACDVPIEWSVEQASLHAPDVDALRQVYAELEMFSQAKDLAPPAAPAKDWQVTALETAEELAAWLADAERPALAMGGMQLGVAAGARCASAPVALAGGLPVKPWAVHDGKAILREHRLDTIADDVMLYEFLLTSEPGNCTLDVMVNKRLNRAPAKSAELAAGDISDLAAMLTPEVARRGLREVYDSIDLPFAPVLAGIERNGIRVDQEALGKLSTLMEAGVTRLTEAVYKEAGQVFNINSPQQLGKVLFDDMKLPAPGKTAKTKSYSTAADVLEALAAAHPVAQLVLEFRQVSKLKGTYVDALPALINPATGRLHTTFNACGAATGRLSSSNPNLQNIPIRTELGREIRAAFVPEPGWKLVVADYSQIELRLLAHFSKDPILCEAFEAGEDIHSRTAAEVFGVMPGLVTGEMRRNAKAVNFGIVYGLSAFGLAQQLGIPRNEADRYIKAYFTRYARVREWLDETVEQVRRDGYTKTLHGRERPIPDINARNGNARGFAERTAVNTPLQGTAADLMKLAMIRIAKILERGWKSRMLLQVHDELVFEAPPQEVVELRAMVEEQMEQVEKLAVPLVADSGVGDNWRDAK